MLVRAQQASTAEDVTAYVQSRIRRTNLYWTPAVKTSTWSVYKIGGNIAMFGGGYFLLESPNMVIDLISGGFLEVGESIAKDALLEVVRLAVNDPQAVCRNISHAVIVEGWDQYCIAYNIARKQTISRADAMTFLKNSQGLAKMSFARDLFNLRRRNIMFVES